jgi:hypothetical protein
MKPRKKKRHRQAATHIEPQPQDVIQVRVQQPSALLEHDEFTEDPQARDDGDEFMNTDRWS